MIESLKPSFKPLASHFSKTGPEAVFLKTKGNGVNSESKLILDGLAASVVLFGVSRKTISQDRVPRLFVDVAPLPGEVWQNSRTPAGQGKTSRNGTTDSARPSKMS